MQQRQGPLQLGWIPYWNLLPVRHEIQARYNDKVVFHPGHPTGVNAALASGAVDIAPCSSVCLLVHPHHEMAAPWGVAANGPVQSVYLGLRTAHPELLAAITARQAAVREIFQLARSRSGDDLRVQAAFIWERCRELGPIGVPPPPLKLSAASATSVALAKIVYNFWFFGEAAERALLVAHTQGHGLFDADPFELWIGDEALVRRRQFHHVVDLGSAWSDMTGLPFVFAVWQSHRARPVPAGWVSRLQECVALAEATMHVEPSKYLLDSAPADSHGDPINLAAYWKAITYRLQGEQLKGLLLFLAMARFVTTQPLHSDVLVRMMRWSEMAERT